MEKKEFINHLASKKPNWSCEQMLDELKNIQETHLRNQIADDKTIESLKQSNKQLADALEK